MMLLLLEDVTLIPPLLFEQILFVIVLLQEWYLISIPSKWFDLQVLWEKSVQIFPPHHLNFMSIEGFKRLFKRAGFEEIDISTPGQLDVDIVRNAFEQSGWEGENKQQRFIKALIKETVSEDFQAFLRRNLMSSHAWVFGIKPE